MPGNGAVGASYGDLLVTSLIVLGGVCVAAFVVVRLVGRFLATGRTRGTRGGHLLDVVARLPLEPRRSLYVVEVAGKTLLLGTSEMGLSLLSELDAGEVRARVAERPSFGELVRAAWLRRRGATAHEAQSADLREPAAQAPALDSRAGAAGHASDPWRPESMRRADEPVPSETGAQVDERELSVRRRGEREQSQTGQRVGEPESPRTAQRASNPGDSGASPGQAGSHSTGTVRGLNQALPDGEHANDALGGAVTRAGEAR